MIDDKLKEILLADPRQPTEYTISQIKQAFAEEGYVYLEDDVEVKDNIIRVKDLHLMTGQEWYSRFEKIVNEWPAYKPINPVRKTMLDIAKKASGLL